jgi:hypothetical protein
MSKKRHTPEQIIAKLRKAEVALSRILGRHTYVIQGENL